MVFGGGEGELFTRFTIRLDVIGHELTHGVTEDVKPASFVHPLILTFSRQGEGISGKSRVITYRHSRGQQRGQAQVF
jgi:Thermolysin metallopeptidase, catalytic domain